MSIIVSNMNMPSGCQKCKFFKKYAFGNGLDYSYSCMLGAKDFLMPWIRQMEERASDCPIEPLEQESILDKIRAEIADIAFDWQEIDGEHENFMVVDLNDALQIIDKYRKEQTNE